MNGEEVDRTIPFFDCHHHLWDLSKGDYEWLVEPGLRTVRRMLGDYAGLRTDWLMEQTLPYFRQANVQRSVHVEAGYSGVDAVWETRWLQDVSATHGFPDAFVVQWDVAGKNAKQQLIRHLAVPEVRGVRVTERIECFARNLSAFGQALASKKISVELDRAAGDIGDALSLVDQNASLSFVLGHAWYPERRDADYLEAWQSDIRAFAAFDNIICKLSGFSMADHAWTIESIRPLIVFCIEVFGPNRVLFGSNWPVESLYGGYVRLIDSYRTILHTEGYATEEQEAMLFRNAERIYLRK